MIKILQGDCLIKLKELEDNSVDSIVTDPPYHLVSIVKRFGGENSRNTPAMNTKEGGVFARKAKGFMGKEWDGLGEDGIGIANNPIMWAECLRVLKPGGHLLAFSGTRTYHRMAVAIEDAGFEVRDMIEWCYGSGFPKSTNIAKQIDKRGGKSVSWFGKWLREWREQENIPQREVSKLFPSKTGGLTGCVANWELGLNMPTNEQFNLICKIFNLPFESLEEAEREIIGTTITNKTVYQNIGGTNISGEINITKGTSEYEGWGTALKPSHESIMVATKPFNTIPLNTCDDCNIQWELISFVKIAEELSKLNQAELNEEMLNSVLKNVEQKNNILGNFKDVMDMLQSNNQIINSTLNIVLSWKRIWEDVLNQMNTSTISMENEMITDLKTLKLLIGQLTLLNIMQVQNNQASGENVNVCIVENLLKGVLWKLRGIQTLSAQENVISKENNSNFVPNHEPICMARKPLAEKTVAENCIKWGTGGINIDESRVESENGRPTGLKKDGTRSQNKAVYGDFNPDTIIGSQETNLGRFPANLIHDNSEEVRECFPETKGGGYQKGSKMVTQGTGGEKTGHIYGAYNGVNHESQSINDGTGNASRFFKSIIYTAKASKSERNKGCAGLELRPGGSNAKGYTQDVARGLDRNRPVANNHPTVKPIALMEYLIKMVTPEGGVVLDPFMGSGSTGVASIQNGFSFIGIEMEVEYIKIAEARINAIEIQTKLEVKSGSDANDNGILLGILPTIL